MLARKDRTEIASPFKVAMNDLTDLNPLGRKFLSDEKQAKRSSILLSSKEGERGENKIRGGGEVGDSRDDSIWAMIHSWIGFSTRVQTVG